MRAIFVGRHKGVSERQLRSCPQHYSETPKPKLLQLVGAQPAAPEPEARREWVLLAKLELAGAAPVAIYVEPES